MKSLSKHFVFVFCLLFVCISCGVSDGAMDDILEPKPEPKPEEKVIETTEEGSFKMIMLGYQDNITEGGVLQPDGFSVPIYISDKKLCGKSCSFALCVGVKRLDAMLESSMMTDWKVQGSITEGATYWVRYASDTKYSYFKMRIAYVESNMVGVEYNSSFEEVRPSIDDIHLTEKEAKAFVFQGYLNGMDEKEGLFPDGIASSIFISSKEFKGLNYTFAEYDGVQELSELPEVTSVTSWKGAAKIAENRAYWLRYITPKMYVYLKLRIAYIDGNNVGVEYRISSKEKVVNANANFEIEGKYYVTDYSVPHLNPDNYYVEHTISQDNQSIFNYALEWSAAKKHSAWVAFSFDNITKKNNVSRTDEWSVDPQLPKEMQVDNEYHKNDGFDRGHLCASEDRVYSKDANKQTFYYSNMSPQFNSFNGGFWASFEKCVRNWGRYSFDKLYVAKGGTLNHLLVSYIGENKGADGVIPKTDADGFTIHGLACPQYYFMAVLGAKDGIFHAIGFWIEHRDDYGYKYGDKIPADVLKKYIVSIDELEEKTGIDFFCNLPDDLENQVEKICDENAWDW